MAVTRLTQFVNMVLREILVSFYSLYTDDGGRSSVKDSTYITGWVLVFSYNHDALASHRNCVTL